MIQRLAAGAASVVLLLGGCGGTAHKPASPAVEATVFYELATIDGFVRTGSHLAEARSELAAIAPHDFTLRHAREKLVTALVARGQASRRALVNAAYLGLLRYQRHHRGVVGLLPD